ncbi:MAG: nucleoside monophosphate kinase [Actinobacteria bacterium]|nr:nucleoside monophosphate kinase [Actinomycetota bacterium]MCL6104685.1 nucleoside monophosphate kinase [Actinomycetota bacterium]
MVRGIKLVVFGRQGSGKGTQCSRLAAYYVVPHISTGDMLRSLLGSKLTTASWLFEKVNRFVQAGELVPDDVIVEMVADRLTKDDAHNRGFVLDGFPRTVSQAEALSKLLTFSDVDLAVELNVPEKEVLNRLLMRRVCTKCGENYTVTTPPKVDWTCDICAGDVVQRPDDTADIIKKRITLYNTQTLPLVQWYKDRGCFISVNGMGNLDVVTQRLIKAINDNRTRRSLVSETEVSETR